MRPAARWSALASALAAAVSAAVSLAALAAPARLRAQSADPVRAGLRLDWSYATCAPAAAPNDGTADRDADGVDDRCETALAQAFAPELVVDPRGCSWDQSVRPARLGGGYLYAAQRAPEAGVVRVAYMPAYYADCGWSGPKCLVAWRSCRGHAGDSELIIVDAAFDAPSGRWATRGVFLSAHCYGRSAGRCRWYRGRDLEALDWARDQPLGAPVVWVAHGSQANYRTRRECDRGFWGYDTCDRNAVRQRFPVVRAEQNVGSRARPFGARVPPPGCVTAAAAGSGSARPDPAAVECVWSDVGAFRGWQRQPGGDAPTPYGRYLRDWARF